ncbi:hypothetical protein GF378_02125, partial [Candidatus Pacearchaeota archaeon]|nr:hypothetical protein [Candidatus Pacearchaeota archaeon]
MKRVLLLLMAVILLSSIFSADIIINEEPRDLYNLGEVIKIPAKIATTSELNDFLSVKLICNGIE